MTPINIQFTLFSAFYTPLIATMSGGFLREQGLEPSWSIAKPGVSAITALANGEAHVVQSALSQGFAPLSRGEAPSCVHFAQVNEMDGFFLTAREPDPDFRWDKLKDAQVLVHHGGQPMAMFKYACHKQGIDFDDIHVIDAGNAAEMDKAFRDGRGQYVHQQGPAPQQLVADGVGHIVTQLGPVIGPCGFSSLAATWDWLDSDMARAFMRAYVRTRHYINDTPAPDIADSLTEYFPNTDKSVLTDCIATYQQLGCWTRHPQITEEAYQATVDIFEFNGLVSQRFGYDEICARPPMVD